MKNYSKPTLRVVELQVEEHIAALVPKTIYERKNGSFIRPTIVGNSGITKLDDYGTSNQLS